jgi:predicted porin
VSALWAFNLISRIDPVVSNSGKDMKITRHRSVAVLALALAGAAAAQPSQNGQNGNGNGNGQNGQNGQGSQNQIYGLLLTSVNTSKTGPSRMTYVDDNGSRLGFRGFEGTGGGVTGLYGLEMGFDASNGTPMSPAFRNSYVGLVGSLGTMAMGRLDSANPTGSPIYTQATQIVTFAPNDSGATGTATILNTRNRVSNAVGYRSPDWGPFVFRARYFMRGATAATVDDEVVTNQGRSLDLGLNYAAGQWRAGFAYGHDSRLGGMGANEMKSKWQTGVRYAFKNVEPYLLYGRESYTSTATSRDSVNYWLAGTKFSTGPHAFVVNIMERDLQISRTAGRTKQQAAYMYALSKRTELQFFVDRDEADTSKLNVTKMTYAAGIRHAF